MPKVALTTRADPSVGVCSAVVPKRNRIIGTTDACISAVETRLRVQFPPSLRSWYLQHNGKSGPFPIPDEREPRTLTSNILDEVDRFKEYVGDCFDEPLAVTETLLPFMCLDGDYFCLQLSDGRREAPVLLWSHETGETTPCAEDFESFLKRFEGGEEF